MTTFIDDIPEQMFMGARVVDINSSIGYDGSRSTCTVTLIERVSDGDKFVVPEMGSPHFFEVVNSEGKILWYFNGIVRSISKEESVNSGHTYSVTLESPDTILDSVALIASDYAGGGYSLDKNFSLMTPFGSRDYSVDDNGAPWVNRYNIFNVFGFWENDQWGYAPIDPSNTRYPGYGLSESNKSGMPWQKVIVALNEIINRTRTNGVYLGEFNNGRPQTVLGGDIAFSSNPSTNKPYLYSINLDNLYTTILNAGLHESYRIGANGSLTDIISELCSAVNCQYFVTLEKNKVFDSDEYYNDSIYPFVQLNSPIKSVYKNVVPNDITTGIIHVQVVDRTSQPLSLNTISGYSFNLKKPDSSQVGVYVNEYPVGSTSDTDYTSTSENTIEHSPSSNVGGKFPSLYTDQTEITNNLVSSRLGLEMADVVTGKIVIGGKRSRLIEYGGASLPQNLIKMYWGEFDAGFNNPSQKDKDKIPIFTDLLDPMSMDDVIPIDVRKWLPNEGNTPVTIGRPMYERDYPKGPIRYNPPAVINGVYYASIMELRFAATDFETWQNYLFLFKQKKAYELGIISELRGYFATDPSDDPSSPKKELVESYFSQLTSSNLATVMDYVNTTSRSVKSNQNWLGQTERINNPVFQNILFNAVKNLYNKFYGKQYLVPLPVFGYNWDSETFKFVPEWSISNSAYTESTDNTDPPNHVAFFDDSFRTIPYAKFPIREKFTVFNPQASGRDNSFRTVHGQLDFTEVSEDDYIVRGNDVFIKTSVDNKIYYLKPSPTNSGPIGNPVENTSVEACDSLSDPSSSFNQGCQPYGKPNLGTTYSTDCRGCFPYARIDLPARILYDADVVGLGIDVNGMQTLFKMITSNTFNKYDAAKYANTIGSDRFRGVMAYGAYYPKTLSVAQQSERFHYGPYLPDFNPYFAGKVEVENDSSLVPENYVIAGYGIGSAGMDAAGYAKALPDNLSLRAVESGSLSLKGVPTVGLGRTILDGGPYVTDVSVGVQASSTETTYTFKTWSLDFGKLKKFYIDRIQKFNKSILELEKSRYSSALENRKLRNSNNIAQGASFGKVLQSYAPQKKEEKTPNQIRSSSSSTMITGLIQTTSKTDPNTGHIRECDETFTSIMPLKEFMANVGGQFNNIGGATLDTIFSPVTLDFESEVLLPKASEILSTESSTPTDISYLDDPDDSDLGDIVKTYPRINAYNMNPIKPYNVPEEGDEYHKYVYGHNYSLVVRGDEEDLLDLNAKHNMYDNYQSFISDDPFGVGSWDIRPMAHRTPALYTGWGFTVAGMPIDGEIYTESYNEDTEISGILPPIGYESNIDNFRTGPLDIRWDKNTGMWTGHLVIEGYTTTSILPASVEEDDDGNNVYGATSFSVKVLDDLTDHGGSLSYNSDGYNYVRGINRDPTLSSSSDTYVQLSYINGEWRPTYVSC